MGLSPLRTIPHATTAIRRTRSQPLCILQLCRLRRRVSRWRPYRNRHVHNRSLTYISMLVARMVQIGMQETLHRPARPRRARREIGSADLRHLSREPRAGLWLCETASLRLRLLPDGNFWATAAGRHDGPRWCGQWQILDVISTRGHDARVLVSTAVSRPARACSVDSLDNASSRSNHTRGRPAVRAQPQRQITT